jgi:hypothetical protein
LIHPTKNTNASTKNGCTYKRDLMFPFPTEWIHFPVCSVAQHPKSLTLTVAPGGGA